jgi:hypothetical protein
MSSSLYVFTCYATLCLSCHPLGTTSHVQTWRAKVLLKDDKTIKKEYSLVVAKKRYAKEDLDYFWGPEDWSMADLDPNKPPARPEQLHGKSEIEVIAESREKLLEGLQPYLKPPPSRGKNVAEQDRFWPWVERVQHFYPRPVRFMMKDYQT